jgi:hypothetical protein
MPKEPEDEIRALAESRKAAIHLNTEFVNAGRSGMAEMLFDIAVATLLGVQVRGVWWEPFHVALRMLSEIFLHDKRPMRAGAVPDHDHRPGKMSPEMWQGDHHIRAPDGLRKMPLEDAARQGQRDDRRELPALAETPQDWRLPDRCPRGGGRGLK